MRKVTVKDPLGTRIKYMMLETVEDVANYPYLSFGDPKFMVEMIGEGKRVLINENGGYCFFLNDYHTIVS